MKTRTTPFFTGLCLLISTTSIFATDSEDFRHTEPNNEFNSVYTSCINADPQETIDICRSVAQKNRHNIRFLQDLGNQLEKSNRYEEAVAVYDEGLTVTSNRRKLTRKHALALSILKEQEQTEPTLYRKDERVTATMDAIKCMRLQPSAAISACRRAIEVDPGNTQLQMRLDDVLLHAGQDRTGERIYTAKPASIQDAPSSELQILEAVHEQNTSQLTAKLQLLSELHEDNVISVKEYRQRKKSLLNNALKSDSDDSDLVTDDKLNTKSDLLRGIDIGRYHALVIGSNEYHQFPQLESAVNDASAVAAILRDEYGFEVHSLTNATRYDILTELSNLRTSLSEQDNLLIFYAGHGVLDNATARGYWLPVDAEENNYANWLSTSDVTDALKGMRSRHVLVVSDSCYSGSLSRGQTATRDVADRRSVLKNLAAKRSRTVISSGGLEPVLDSGGGDHSVFTAAFLQSLRGNLDVIEASAIFSQLREQVVANADQTPEYKKIQKAGHEGGDFVFVRVRQ